MKVTATQARGLGALPRATPKTPAQVALARAQRERHEVSLEAQIQGARFPYFHRRQYEFLGGRKYKADFAFPEAMILVEVDGNLYAPSKHRGVEREAEMERDALAMCAGWRTLRISPRMVADGRALAWITHLLGAL